MENVVTEEKCVILNVQLAVKHLRDGNIELAKHRVKDARRSLEALNAEIKKAN